MDPSDLLISLDDASRARRPPDYRQEALSLRRFAEGLSEHPEQALQRLSELVVEQGPAESAGVSLLSEDGQQFAWPAIAGAWARHAGAVVPVEASPCAWVLARQTTLLFRDPQRCFAAAGIGEPPAREMLLAPLRSGGRIVGTLWALLHEAGRQFDAEDARLLDSLAGAAGAALRQFSETLEPRIERALAEKKIYADVLERSPGAVTVLSSDFRILAINPANVDAFELAFGTRPQVGDPFLALFDGFPEVLAQQQQIWRRALDGEAFVVTDEFGYEGLSRRYYEVRFSPLRDPRGALIGASSTSYDVTDRVQAERQLAEAQEQLRQSQKMEAVGQLTGGLAHDFNNLLSTVAISLQLLRRRFGVADVGELEAIVARADRSVQRAAALTHRMLAFSRQQVLDVRPVDVNALATGMVEMLGRTLGEHVALELALDEPPGLALTDANQLESALLNLALNARDAMPAGGRLAIGTESMRIGPEGLAGARGLKPGDYVVLSVTDDGEGMAAEVALKAFDPFFTTKPPGQGSGLGLAMIYGFAKQSGGDAFIHSRPGEGTTVKLFLPRTEGIEATSAPRADSLPPQRGQGECILVVDDETDLRAAVVVALADLGYRSIEAGDAASALALLASDTSIELLLTDIGLPDLSGRALADRARERRPALKVLFMSGYAKGTAVRGDIVREGMDMLFKPFAIESLARKVRSLTQDAGHADCRPGS